MVKTATGPETWLWVYHMSHYGVSQLNRVSRMIWVSCENQPVDPSYPKDLVQETHLLLSY